MNMNKLVEEQTYKALARVLEKEDRREGIHISNLVYDCLRRGYYGLTKERRYDMDGLLRMAYGTLIHEFRLASGSEHEQSFDDWNGIIGTPDEVWQGLVIDKKTTANPPRNNKPRAHHRKQVQMYGAILDDRGYDIIGGSIIYIVLGKEPDIKVTSFSLNAGKFEQVREEMLQKKSELEMALEVGEPPERDISWLCKYCDFVKQCFWDDSDEDWGDEGGYTSEEVEEIMEEIE